MPLKSRLNSVVRRAALRYSVHNRHRKADQILSWLREQGVEDVLFVGTLGDRQSSTTDLSNADIVERRIADNYEIKMSIDIEPAATKYPFLVADARNMPFPDNYVDFALANAVIEHVGQEVDQQRMVDEMTRVSRTWVITTPNKWFPVESHTSAVLLHWFPSWRKRHDVNFSRLLSLREFRALLPHDAEVFGAPWSPTFLARYAGDAEQRRVSR